MIFRNDDVNPNTDLEELRDIYSEIYHKYPDVTIISGVTVFSGASTKQSIYEEVPFKHKPKTWFYKVKHVINSWFGKVASHGLLHSDHSVLSKDAQEMSILTSCSYLDTDIFIPPFNRFNEDTISVCKENNIQLIGYNEKWLSLEHNNFNDQHDKWYFHSWRIHKEKMRNMLNVR